MMQDTINSIRVTLNERIGNPFISATIIACIVLNWQLSLLLFSDVPYDSKIEKIISLYPDSSSRYESFLIIPLCFGVFWTFVWPVINMGINAYWYLMKANISNVKLWAERKRKLSEADAAELYSTIDAQESRYLEFLKDRQNKIENLSKQISDFIHERTTLHNEIERHKSEKADLETTLSGSQRELSIIRESLNRASSESDVHRRALEEAANRSIEFAKFLPGLKSLTNAINQTTNHQANETWILEEFERQEPSYTREDRQKMFNFFLGLGLIKREANGNIGFGDRYRYAKDSVLGMYNNSPEIINL
jgi:hypothetical protein